MRSAETSDRRCLYPARASGVHAIQPELKLGLEAKKPATGAEDLHYLPSPETARIALFLRSRRPWNGSITSPAGNSLAMALIVKSRERARSASIERPCSSSKIQRVGWPEAIPAGSPDRSEASLSRTMNLAFRSLAAAPLCRAGLPADQVPIVVRSPEELVSNGTSHQPERGFLPARSDQEGLDKVGVHSLRSSRFQEFFPSVFFGKLFADLQILPGIYRGASFPRQSLSNSCLSAVQAFFERDESPDNLVSGLVQQSQPPPLPQQPDATEEYLRLLWDRRSAL